MVNSFHSPVLTKEVIYYLNCKKEGIYIDCTLGGGGHAESILEKIYPDGLLIGIDQDIEAIEAASRKLKNYLDRVKLVKDNFNNLEKILNNLKIKKLAEYFLI